MRCPIFLHTYKILWSDHSDRGTFKAVETLGLVSLKMFKSKTTTVIVHNSFWAITPEKIDQEVNSLSF